MKFDWVIIQFVYWLFIFVSRELHRVSDLPLTNQHTARILWLCINIGYYFETCQNAMTIILYVQLSIASTNFTKYFESETVCNCGMWCVIRRTSYINYHGTSYVLDTSYLQDVTIIFAPFSYKLIYLMLTSVIGLHMIRTSHKHTDLIQIITHSTYFILLVMLIK